MSFSEDVKHRPLCYVSYPNSPSVGQILRTLQSGLANQLRGEIVTSSGGGLLVPTQGGNVIVMTISQRLPINVVTDDQAQSIAWPQWKASNERWRAHSVVASLATPDSPTAAKILTSETLRVAAVIAHETGAEGAGWGGSGLFYNAETFHKICYERKLPTELLVRCSWKKSDDQNSISIALTKGLRFFGISEICYYLNGEKPGKYTI